MNTAELVDQIAAHDDKITKGQAKALVDALLGAIRDAAVRGEEVSLPGFGKFKVQSKPARTGRNPRTGEPVSVGQKRAPFFRTGKELRERLNGGTPEP